jgi:hypothetical protein
MNGQLNAPAAFYSWKDLQYLRTWLGIVKFRDALKDFEAKFRKQNEVLQNDIKKYGCTHCKKLNDLDKQYTNMKGDIRKYVTCTG